MPKYQFFERQQEQKKETCYICAGDADFLPRKEQLLQQGYEVVGDMIYAADAKEAISHYQSGMSYPASEYGKAHLTVGLCYAAASAIEEGTKLVKKAFGAHPAGTSK